MIPSARQEIRSLATVPGKAMHEPRYQSEKLKYLRAGNLIEKLCFNCFALCSEGAQKRKAMSLGRISQHRSVYFGELA
ncbi:hypothetical protein GQ607_011390 [Colletotrichum asianum]|uniref:Uncharacterized protein n=1 Tax=Colletotrichum asianum TaxID=702518 RepID=A0A8H3W8U6_9PEZI|nr:hypothetical protein GQ607_011390 [Colletotrichum asianum]